MEQWFCEQCSKGACVTSPWHRKRTCPSGDGGYSKTPRHQRTWKGVTASSAGTC